MDRITPHTVEFVTFYGLKASQEDALRQNECVRELEAVLKLCKGEEGGGGHC